MKANTSPRFRTRIGFALVISSLLLASLAPHALQAQEEATERTSSSSAPPSTPSAALQPQRLVTPSSPASPPLSPQDLDEQHKGLKTALLKEIQDVRGILQSIKAQSPHDRPLETPLGSIADNILSSFLWQYAFRPAIGVLVTLLGSVAIFGKLALRSRSLPSGPAGESPKESSFRESLLTFTITLSAAYVVAFVLVALSYTVHGLSFPTQSTFEAAGVTTRLNAIDTRLRDIEKILRTGPEEVAQHGFRPIQGTDAELKRMILSAVGVIILGAFAFLVAHCFRPERLLVPIGGKKEPGSLREAVVPKELLTPVVLSLMLLLLPGLAIAFVLPFILQFYLLAFIELVLLQRDRHITDIVRKHISVLIFLAVLGTCWNFAEALHSLLSPFWEAYRSYGLGRRTTAWDHWLDYAWRVAPLALAIVGSLPQWRHIRLLALKRLAELPGEPTNVM